MSDISAVAPRAAYILQTPEAQRHASEAAVGFGRSPAKLVEGIELATAQLFSAAAAAAIGAPARGSLDPSAPQLRAPAVTAARAATGAAGGGEELTPEAQLALLMAELQEILGDAVMRSLADRAKAMIERLRAAQSNAHALSAAYQAVMAELEAAVDGLDGAVGNAEAAVEAAEAARKEVERLQAELEEMDPESPDYAALSERVGEAETKAEAAEKLASAATSAVTTAQGKVDAVAARMESIQGNMNGAQSYRSPLAIPNDGKQNLSTAAALGQMIAMLNEIGSKMQLLKLQADSEYATQVLRAGVEANMKRSEEYQEQLEKARNAERTMGCIGKIVGWVVTVVMVAAAPFTGGASMALAAVSLALMITEEATGFSVLGKALEPLMTYVLQPLIKELTSFFSNVLQDVLGINADLADKIGAALGAVFAAAIVIVAVIVGKSAGTKLLGPMLKAVSSQITKVLPKMLTNFTLGASEQAVMRAGYAMTTAEVAGFGMATGRGVGNIMVADMHVKAADIMGAIEVAMANSDIARLMLDRANEQFSHGTEMMQSMLVKMSNVAAESEQTNSYIVNRMKHA